MISEPKPGHLVWLDGEFVAWQRATMHLSAHHYGVGVFEGVRAYASEGGASVFRLQDHTARLFRSARILNIAIPEECSRERLNEIQLELLRKNGLSDAYVRPFVFYGGTSGLSRNLRGLRVHVAVFALAWCEGEQSSTSAHARKRPIALRTASFTRVHANSVLSKAKANGNYMNGILALQEAQACGADEALLLDQNGFATETSGSNLFVVRDGRLSTPPLELALEGVTRDTIIELSRSFGWSVTERHLTRDEIYVADEVFVTGTAAEVTPVAELDGRKIRNGLPGPMTERLRAAYGALVRGQGEAHDEWLTRV
jgi:branched-chain amino acid aminotransferase